MPWRKSKSPLAQQYLDLRYIPHGRSAWDCTLSCLAFGIRMDISGASVDLNAWAARHGLFPSSLYQELADNALVLWHGTSRERAERIIEHGLFHKKGLWTAVHPRIPHSFCRSRSERFGTEGAVVCIVLDRNEITEGRDFEARGDVIRFHHGLPPDVVQYVLLREEVRFTGDARGNNPKPWPGARFKYSAGEWCPVQTIPVRFSDSDSFSTLDEFVNLCVSRIFFELSDVTPLEVLSVLYSLVQPWDCLTHKDVINLLESVTLKRRNVGKWRLFSSNRSNQSAPVR